MGKIKKIISAVLILGVLTTSGAQVTKTVLSPADSRPYNTVADTDDPRPKGIIVAGTDDPRPKGIIIAGTDDPRPKGIIIAGTDDPRPKGIIAEV